MIVRIRSRKIFTRFWISGICEISGWVLKSCNADFVYLPIMKHFLTFVAILALTCSVMAQNDCGTVTPPGYVELFKQRVATAQTNRISGGLIIVPVHIHLLRESNGNSALTLQDIQTELDSVNYFTRMPD